jgi:ankyrin repeat protein
MTNEADVVRQEEPDPGAKLAAQFCEVIQKADLEKVSAQLADQADPNHADEAGVTPLAWAAYAGRLEIVEALLQKGAVPDAESIDPTQSVKPDERIVPMTVAAFRGHKAAFDRLWQVTNPKVRQRAIKRLAMFQKTCDNKKRKRDPRILELHAAIDRNDVTQVSRLIAQGVDVNVGDTAWGHRPLVKASSNQNLETVRLLLSAGAHPDGYLGVDLTPISCALTVEIVEALLHAGADPNASHCADVSVFNASIAHNLAGVAKLLVDAGAELNAPPSIHECALSSALSKKSFDVARILIEAGADVNNAPKKGWSPLMYAVSSGSDEMVRLLLDAGADPNFSDPTSLKLIGRKLTPLSLAEEEGRTTIIDLLGAKGAK